MNKFKICTYHINFENANPIYEQIFNISSKINKQYCEMNGYDYTSKIFDESVIKNFLEDDFFKIDTKWAKACVYKYQYILDVLDSSENDFIVYVEYDSCFCNTVKKLEDYVDDNHSIFYSRCNWSWDIQRYLKIFNEMGSFLNEHINQIINFDTCSDILTDRKMKGYMQILNFPTFINEGFYIFKNDSISRKFLKSIIDFSYIFYDDDNDVGLSAEGQVIGKLSSLPCFYKHLKPLPPKTQGHIYGGSNRYNEDECLVCHNSSIDKNILLEKMISISKNKYWKDFIN